MHPTGPYSRPYRAVQTAQPCWQSFRCPLDNGQEDANAVTMNAVFSSCGIISAL